MAQDVFVHLAPLSITYNRKTINVNRDYPQALGSCRSLWGLDKSL